MILRRAQRPRWTANGGLSQPSRRGHSHLSRSQRSSTLNPTERANRGWAHHALLNLALGTLAQFLLVPPSSQRSMSTVTEHSGHEDTTFDMTPMASTSAVTLESHRVTLRLTRSPVRVPEKRPTSPAPAPLAISSMKGKEPASSKTAPPEERRKFLALDLSTWQLKDNATVSLALADSLHDLHALSGSAQTLDIALNEMLQNDSLDPAEQVHIVQLGVLVLQAKAVLTLRGVAIEDGPLSPPTGRALLMLVTQCLPSKLSAGQQTLALEKRIIKAQIELLLLSSLAHLDSQLERDMRDWQEHAVRSMKEGDALKCYVHALLDFVDAKQATAQQRPCRAHQQSLAFGLDLLENMLTSHATHFGRHAVSSSSFRRLVELAMQPFALGSRGIASLFALISHLDKLKDPRRPLSPFGGPALTNKLASYIEFIRQSEKAHWPSVNIGVALLRARGHHVTWHGSPQFVANTRLRDALGRQDCNEMKTVLRALQLPVPARIAKAATSQQVEAQAACSANAYIFVTYCSILARYGITQEKTSFARAFLSDVRSGQSVFAKDAARAHVFGAVLTVLKDLPALSLTLSLWQEAKKAEKLSRLTDSPWSLHISGWTLILAAYVSTQKLLKAWRKRPAGPRPPADATLHGSRWLAEWSTARLTDDTTAAADPIFLSTALELLGGELDMTDRSDHATKMRDACLDLIQFAQQQGLVERALASAKFEEQYYAARARLRALAKTSRK
ncbi:uncharacterized protein L969DRAFT_85680 [Mixia osmundae IAM 14324]|uniref:Uncharacterized protein n=1 Tax=Mixia osmundae (strain CBS 9802 / IAM 14324 / JCM 22182 / KY 12970) TaxID=764103 RepID=G7E674_MIXOS|nr:uncharacterized protein L969DRAFT_85680 [Mixia osmundae IAM 14324]KEI40512.1 hypothetical protein L969DRAFT_85680 [Mixia osmundae IAM 14324]GAA98334.1 hypothetical protein E5Q_05019 [Mixia osmundae IAM 14324]